MEVDLSLAAFCAALRYFSPYDEPEAVWMGSGNSIMDALTSLALWSGLIR
jgi:hypothetical protein